MAGGVSGDNRTFVHGWLASQVDTLWTLRLGGEPLGRSGLSAFAGYWGSPLVAATAVVKSGRD
jgi:hypothetical protein